MRTGMDVVNRDIYFGVQFHYSLELAIQCVSLYQMYAMSSSLKQAFRVQCLVHADDISNDSYHDLGPESLGNLYISSTFGTQSCESSIATSASTMDNTQLLDHKGRSLQHERQDEERGIRNVEKSRHLWERLLIVAHGRWNRSRQTQ